MKLRYKFIHFVQMTGWPVWTCCNNRSGVRLATVQYYKPWKQYVVAPEPDTVFSADCLADIQDFIGRLVAASEGATSSIRPD